MDGPADAPQLSIVIPVFDERDSLEALHREIDAVSVALPQPLEIVFVDDGSADGSAERLAEIADKDARVRVLTLASNAGQSAALGAGFAAARGEWIATLDADLQNDPGDLPAMMAMLSPVAGPRGVDVVCGVRTPRADDWRRRAAARVANAARNALTRDGVSDIGCALRVMRASHARRVKMLRGMHRFLPTLLAMEGARVVEIPVSHRPRRFGRSKYGILDRLWVGCVDALAVRWMQSRTVGQRATERKRG